jgi:hypothetical protein
MTRTILTPELLRTAPRPKPVDVPLPELGEGVVVPVWPMTAREWTQFQSEQQGPDGKPNANVKLVRERLVVKCCRNDDGAPIFTRADFETIGSTSAAIVERIVNKALELSGAREADLKSIEKNSEPTQGG